MNSRADFAGIEAFASVVETGSFRAAAAALGAPISTVSVQVTRLENHLGARLLARTTRSVSPTDEGRAYFAQIRGALEAVREADRSLLGRDHQPRGQLRVASPSEFGQAVLGKVVARYVERCPEVEVAIELRDDRVDPVRDAFDVVLQAEPASSPSIVARKLGAPMPFRIVASRGYLARAGTPAHPRELARHRCLVMAVRSSRVQWPFAHAGRRFVAVPGHAVANSWTLLGELSAAGLGLARLPEYLASPAIARGDVVAILEAYRPPPEQLFAVYPRSPHVPARCASFVEQLRAFLAVWPGCLHTAPDAARRHRA